MLRRIAPVFAVLICFLIDTALIPTIYYGIYLVPITLIAVMAVAVLRGRFSGMLYAFIAGLLMDVTAGSLGLKTIAFTAIGFVYGFFLDHDEDIATSVVHADRILALIRRCLWTFILYSAYEIAMLLYQYFNNAIWNWGFVLNLLIRTVEFDVLAILLFPLFRWMFVGRKTAFGANAVKREMKNY